LENPVAKIASYEASSAHNQYIGIIKRNLFGMVTHYSMFMRVLKIKKLILPGG
jgi:hypothetical protein